MRRLPLLHKEQAAEAGRAAAAVIRDGGVVLLPTETFYGLAVDPERGEAVRRLYAMKGRPPAVALPVLCADWQQLEALVSVPDRYRVRLGRIWPGPLTAVLPLRRALPVTTSGTLAVRIPGHALLRAVLYRTGAVTGTSANRHGEPPASTADEALAALAPSPDLALDGGAAPGGSPTTVVDLTGEEPLLVRAGAFCWQEEFPWEQDRSAGWGDA